MFYLSEKTYTAQYNCMYIIIKFVMYTTDATPACMCVCEQRWLVIMEFKGCRTQIFYIVARCRSLLSINHNNFKFNLIC